MHLKLHFEKLAAGSLLFLVVGEFEFDDLHVCIFFVDILAN